MSLHTAEHRFQHKGWDVVVALDADRVDGLVAGHADLYHEGAHRCRVALAGKHVEGASALVSLADQTRTFIDDWLKADHSGNTGFADL